MTMALPFSSETGDTLAVVLSHDSAGDYVVRSVVIESGSIRNSYVFRAGRPVGSTFIPDFARCIHAILRRCARASQPLAEPEFEFFSPGIGLSELYGTPVADDDCPNAVELRFERYVGDATQLLLLERSLEVAPATIRERIAVEVLRDIVSPIFDMMSLSEPHMHDVVQQHTGAIQARLDRLAAQQEEIKLYTGLLKRYVDGCRQDAAALETSSPVTTDATRHKVHDV
ncbi:hypothetical protein [Litoreibacter albidus]|uniref:Uncharacterized protein n=1 Tax=Litoreibacter albidus TaxID=670155 RepID=A0A1H2QR90_9RHOB|nr:hypothetical protein [Litoreibacter albidus]SDW09605.1 hypothetical protein SAMN04488001_0272 [Litoreibacter albidus]